MENENEKEIIDRVTIGKRVREQRKKKKMKIEELAEAAGVGRNFIGEIERGLKMPSLNSVIKIVNALDISADVLLRFEVEAAKPYVLNEMTERMKVLRPAQLKMVSGVFNSMLENMGLLEQEENEADDY